MFFKWKRKYKELEEKYDFLANTLTKHYEVVCDDLEKQLDKIGGYNITIRQINEELQAKYTELEKKYQELENEKYPTHMILEYATERPIILNAAVEISNELLKEHGEEYKQYALQKACEELVKQIYEKKLYRLSEDYNSRFNNTNLRMSIVVSEPYSHFYR